MSWTRSLTLTLLLSVGILTASCDSPMECTNVGCTSTLSVEIAHDLDLAAGPYRFEIDTGLQTLRCSVGPEPTGDRSCFGFRFADLDWDATSVTLLLTDPFEGGEPPEMVDVVVVQGDTELSRQSITVDRGETERPNGPDCPGMCWQAVAATSL